MKRIKKPKLIVAILLFLSLACFIAFAIIMVSSSDHSKPDTGKLEGQSRIDAENAVTRMINGYVSEVPTILDYSKSKELKMMSIKDLKLNYDVDIHEFEELDYGCSSNTTFIIFDENYEGYKIAIDCKAFYR